MTKKSKNVEIVLIRYSSNYILICKHFYFIRPLFAKPNIYSPHDASTNTIFITTHSGEKVLNLSNWLPTKYILSTD